MSKILYCPSAFTLDRNNPKLYKSIIKQIGLKIIMDNNFAFYRGPKLGIPIIRDSGGLQLGRGQRTSINVEKFYSKAEEENIFGIMSVDFPLLHKPTLEEELKQAEFQKNQTEKIKKVMNVKRLYNIIHGFNYESYNEYHKIVFDKDLHKLSVADYLRNDPYCFIASFIKFFDKWWKQYKYVHILGGYSVTRCIGALIWLTHHRYKDKDIIITFDHSGNSLLGNKYWLNNPLKSTCGIFSEKIVKMCGCPLCKKFGTKFNKINPETGKRDITARSYCTLHNIGTYLQMVEQLNKDAKKLTLEEYCKKWKLDYKMYDILKGNFEKYLNCNNRGFLLEPIKEQAKVLFGEKVDIKKISKVVR